MKAPDRFPTRLTLFASGSILLATGISLLIRSGIGVAPLDTVNTGLAARTGLAVGTCSWITAGLLMILAMVAGRRLKPGTIVSSLLIGAAINVTLTLIPAANGIAAQVVLALLGFTVLYAGITLLVTSGLGAGPSEELMLGLSDRGVPIYLARWGIEAALLVIGWALGGQIGVGTLLFVVLTGPTLHRSIPLLARALHLAAPADADIPAEPR